MKNPKLWVILLALASPSWSQINFTNFHTPAQIDTELTNLASTHSNIAQISSIGNSIEMRPIRVLQISDPSVTGTKGDVVFVGLHHAREWLAAEMPLYLAEYLLTHYNTDPSLKACMKNLRIWVIPVLNPDGYVYTSNIYRYWRKNRRNNNDGTFGVDLNRNYSYQWGLNSGSSGVTNDDIYRGTAAFSEPETLAFRNFVQGLQNPKALVTYHTFSELFLRPWGYSTGDPPGEPSLAFIAQDSISRIAAVHGHTYGEVLGYLASGEATDYFWGEMRLAAFTPEMRPGPGGIGGFAPPASEIIPSNEENLQAALALIRDAGCRKLWIKDHPSDNGDEPSAVWTGTGWSQPFWISPDIWTTPATLVAGSTVTLSVRVHNDNQSAMHKATVRAYYTDPRIALEFPNPNAVLIGEQTLNLPPGDKVVSFPWVVPTGTNIWGEHHWCVGAIVSHPDDRPLTTQIQRSSNIGARNFQTVEMAAASTLFVAITNFLDVAAEYEVVVDRRLLPRDWEVIVPPIPPKRKVNRKARLLRVRGQVLEPGETVVQPVRVIPPENPQATPEVNVNVQGVLKPLVPGKRVAVGNGYTFQIHTGPRQPTAQ
jgi:hypothetical protein